MSECLADGRVGVPCTRHLFSSSGFTCSRVRHHLDVSSIRPCLSADLLARVVGAPGSLATHHVPIVFRSKTTIEVRTRCRTSSLHRPPCLRAGLRRRWHRRQRQAHAVGTHCAQLAWDRNCTSTVDSSRAASVASEVLAQTSMHLIRYSYNVHGVRIAESTVHYSHSTAAGHLSKLNQNHMNKGEAKSQAFSI